MSRPARADADAPADDGTSGPVVCFHGTRGSVPTPEPANAHTGGDTSCVEIRYGARRLILDAGTGIRRLNRTLSCTECAAGIDIFLTHFHWDHVQGLPFFAPLQDPAAHVRIHAPSQDDVCIADLLGGRLAPVYFPVPYDAFAARTTLHSVNDGPWACDGVEVSSMRVVHPSHTHGYRVRCGGSVIVHVPDNELGDMGATGGGAYDALCAFVAGADLLIHDAMLTDAEYRARRGWGHSTFGQAIRLAEDAGVRRLRFFHHDPDRDDVALASIMTRIRRELAQRGSTLCVDVARDGETVRLARGDAD